jgi:hypothetical protein
MFAYIDPIIFPDDCEILQISADRYVYPIFKNGSSSLRKTGYRKISASEFANVKTVEVFLRDPLDRYVSGVQTYLKKLDCKYDRETVLGMIDQYLFLNRHFCLQFHWLINLSRHTQAQIHVRSISELEDLTNLIWNTAPDDKYLAARFAGNQKLDFYLQLDKILINDFMHETVRFQDIVAHVKQNYSELYQEILGRSQNLCSVLD